MDIRRHFVFAVLSAFFFFPARADTAAAIEPAAIPSAEKRPQRGALYRIRHQKGTAYLFGTIHAGKPGYFPLNAEVTQALAASSKLIVEIDLRKQDRFAAALDRVGMYRDGTTIDRHVSVDTLLRLKKATDLFGIRFDSIARMKPWMIANLLTSVDIERYGLHLSQGVDLHLLTLAGPTKAVLELESAAYQLSLFGEMRMSDQETYLLETLDSIETGEGIEQAHAIANAWANADSGKLNAVMLEGAKEKPVSSAFLQDVC
ncbi:MAG TPA: TraB/GumN family protein [Noviherbaspirillum sp.]|jgi:hypothetical protein|uniref:TraB/GumN family protein n=1 Tax=Noviherbaspirillum sp. TaxID=1926288 RepID=UPI002DDC9FAB|nr:TraB/GumN family protein [Noviherbaspirillum sp.]HEV2611130.1 TraB/GumN family protein [Noviherbaspirillum sp.]